MKKQTENDIANISILREKYGGHCKVVFDDIAGRIMYWTL